MLASPPSKPIRLYGRWRNQASLSLPTSVHPILVHEYNMPIKPSQPLRLGLRVQLMALSPMIYRSLTPCFSHPLYDVYDPQIEGAIGGVRVHEESELVYFAIRNQREQNEVRGVIVVTPYIPEVTLAESSPRQSCGWLDAMVPCEQGSAGHRSAVKLQEGAEVIDGFADSPTPVVSFRYPDPAYIRDKVYIRL